MAVAIDPAEDHTYSVDWTDYWVAWYIDDRLVRVVRQSPGYPLQLMLSLYEFPGRPPRDTFEPVFDVDWVRGYAPPAPTP